MSSLPLIVAFIISGQISQQSVAADADKSGVINSALAVLTGDNSHVSKPAFTRIDSSSLWKKTWLTHLGKEQDTIYRTAMEVDFGRCTVTAIFGGQSVNSCGYRIESVHENGNTIVVRFDDISFQTAGPDGGAVQVRPYAFIVLPKTSKPIVLEENVQSYKREEPEWKEVARLKRS
jgi:hypothetical protein